MLPFGIFIGMEGKRFQRRFVDGLKETSPATFHLFKLAVIELDKLFRDGLVELGQAEEGIVSQGGPVIHISAIFTAASTLALSFGFLTRVGIITVP